MFDKIMKSPWIEPLLKRSAQVQETENGKAKKKNETKKEQMNETHTIEIKKK